MKETDHVNDDVRQEIPPAPRRLTAAGLKRLRLLAFGKGATLRWLEIAAAVLQAALIVFSLAVGKSVLFGVSVAVLASTVVFLTVNWLVCTAKVERLRHVCERGSVAVGTVTQALWIRRWMPEMKRARPVCTVIYRFADDRGLEQSKREIIWSGVQPVPCETGSEIVVLFDQLDPRRAIAPQLHGINFE